MSSDDDLVAGLRAREEDAFREAVSRYQASMKRVARAFVRSDDVADEVVQETWLQALNGIDRFEGRSSFKTWLFTILRNRAQTRGSREARSRPFSAMGASNEVDADTFDREANWLLPPSVTELSSPSDDTLRDELFREVEMGLSELPENQRMVVTLRDLLGWSSEEVRDYMEISEANQRVLLHRGRSRLRKFLSGYLSAEV